SNTRKSPAGSRPLVSLSWNVDCQFVLPNADNLKIALVKFFNFVNCFPERRHIACHDCYLLAKPSYLFAYPTFKSRRIARDRYCVLFLCVHHCSLARRLLVEHGYGMSRTLNGLSAGSVFHSSSRASNSPWINGARAFKKALDRSLSAK